MRPLCCILLAIAVISIATKAASTEVESQVTTLDTRVSTRLLTHRWRDAPTRRPTRYTTNNEERGITISAQQLKDLLKKGESADNVFKLMALDKAGDELLSTSQLTTWINYMKEYNIQQLTQHTSLLLTLLKNYGADDVAKMIEAAKKVEGTEGMTKRLEFELMQRWLSSGKSPDDVFTLLKLDEVGDKLLKSPQLNTWIKYVDDFNKKRRTKASLMSPLATHYNDETLVKLLIAAKMFPATEKVAIRVQSEQTLYWIKEKKSPDNVFILLKLNKANDKLFESPLFSAWIKYADDYRFAHPGKELATMSTLRAHYDDDAIAKMITKASTIPSMMEIASRLNTQQFGYWLGHTKFPDEVFSLLKLKEAGDKLFDSPNFLTWYKYMVYFKARHPKEKVDILTILTKKLGEEELMQTLLASKNTKKISAQLLDEQLNRWLDEKKDPLRVYYLLRANADEANAALYKNYHLKFKRKVANTRRRPS